MAREFITHLIHSKKLKYNYNSKSYSIGMSFTEFIITISNEFIKWYGTDKMGEYHVVFFKAGFNAIVKKWINGGCKESPLEIENVIKSEYKKRIAGKKRTSK